ncbi:PIG-L deacetylase family protein [Tichowtungia aerotolerans]|uniref:PIG-L family deacetylase n=1 Tax=Tichowtungia aerotolerans TaxID=2697043 RepID=A0A6P1M4J6_9BACT|nr:PIG-L deacetylase family protein [Tichowtungia aerotolerans]QHI69520.1 hypothetical protein GT409_08645 [Tichowtungia aerotolerans]
MTESKPMVKKGILLSMLLAAICHSDPVDGLDGMAGSSTMDEIEDWFVVTGSVQSVTNGYGAVGMISAAGSNSLWTAEYVSSDVLQTNAVYGLAVRAGNWSSNPGSGTVFAIAIGYYDSEWHELTNKTFTGGTAGEITPTINGSYETLVFTNELAVFANVAVRVGRTGTSGSWGGFDTVSLTILQSDSDGDGLPDRWEFDYGLNPNDGGTFNFDDGDLGDPDDDGLQNHQEYSLGSDPLVDEWKSRPEKARLMVINAHPDDEAIFFGGAIPYYTQVRQLPTIVISMTSGLVSETEIHEAEFRSACWAYGLRNQPVFARFYNNVWNASLDETWDTWADGVLDGDDITEGQALAAETLTYWIRRYQPDVVVTHDLEGEYGHSDHIATAITATNAVQLAADTNYVDGLQPWQVKKLYLHMYPTNQLFHDFWQDVSIDTNADATADITPMDAADIGLAFHVYQGTPTNASTVYAVNETSDAGWEPYPSEWWGLVSSTVGADTATSFTAPDADNVEISYVGWARGDFFEHITVFADSDYDQLPDDWELAHFPSLEAADPDADPDGDGLDNAAEFGAGTNPALSDTDGDSFNDGLEVINGGDPLVSDLWRIDYIRDNGADYDLYSSNAVLDLSIGQAAFAVSGGTAWLALQLEKSEDLITWTNAGDTVIWSIPVNTNNAFYRVRSSR